MNGYDDLGRLCLEEDVALEVVRVLSRLAAEDERTDGAQQTGQLGGWYMAVTGDEGWSGYGLTYFGRDYGLYFDKDLTLRKERWQERLRKTERAALEQARYELELVAISCGLKEGTLLAVGEIGVRSRVSALAGRGLA